MANGHVWYELITSDDEAAAAFYAEVVGWRITDSGMTAMRYSILHAGETPIGGLMAMEGGPQPSWSAYIGVDDVDTYAAKVTAAGGSIHMGPDDIPQVGRFAMVADPQGAAFVLFKSAGFQAEPLPYMTPGTCGWHELHTSDAEAAFGFYADLFGWTKDQALDMGPMGTYQLIRTGGATPTGAMMNNPQQQPAWLYYFAVDDIETAEARVAGAGGTIRMGPMEVPGGAWVLMGQDPQGASFALVAPPKAS